VRRNGESALSSWRANQSSQSDRLRRAACAPVAQRSFFERRKIGRKEEKNRKAVKNKSRKEGMGTTVIPSRTSLLEKGAIENRGDVEKYGETTKRKGAIVTGFRLKLASASPHTKETISQKKRFYQKRKSKTARHDEKLESEEKRGVTVEDTSQEKVGTIQKLTRSWPSAIPSRDTETIWGRKREKEQSLKHMLRR